MRVAASARRNGIGPRVIDLVALCYEIYDLSRWGDRGVISFWAVRAPVAGYGFGCIPVENADYPAKLPFLFVQALFRWTTDDPAT